MRLKSQTNYNLERNSASEKLLAEYEKFPLIRKIEKNEANTETGSKNFRATVFTRKKFQFRPKKWNRYS